MTVDAYDWEFTNDRFKVDVVAGIYICGANEDGQPEIKCGFVETNTGLHLPYAELTHNKYAAIAAVGLFREWVGIDPRTLDIVPYGFFDPLVPQLDENDMEDRRICLGYRARIHPGTPIHPKLRILSHEQIELARDRIARGHYAAYRAGIS